jgi:hypothetical protein
MLLRYATSKLAFLIVFAFGLVPAASAQSDKASQSVSAMISALGGKPFLEVREIQATGKAFSFKGGRASGSDVFIDYIKFPDKERTEHGSYRIKPTDIHSGDAGWSVYDKKIETFGAADVREFQAAFKTGFQYLSRFILNRAGLSILHAGSELLDFKRNDVLEFRDSGTFFRLFVDQQSHLPTKLQVRRDGESFLREEQFANWHEFQGMPTALFITHFKDGEKTMEIRFDNVIYNPGLADSLFAPPAPSSK